MPGQHALLSPSSAHRWLHCTASARLEAQAPDRDTEFAQEGTLAHSICSRKLKEYLHQDTTYDEWEAKSLQHLYQPEMEEHTDTYRDIVLAKLAEAREHTRDALLMVEKRLYFSAYVPDAFGTADAIIIADDLMEVIDFKYGKGVRVDAYENPQMMIYALGAYSTFDFEYNIRRVKMTIVQPRLDNVSEYEISVNALITWASTTLMPKSREAYRGDGTLMPGEWCQFCKVKGTCKELAQASLGAMKRHPDVLTITKAEMERDILPLLPTFKTWLSGVEDYALQQALSGVRYDGFKVVEGRSVRRIADPAKAEAALKGAGYAPDDYLKPQELKTITDLEKVIGKKTFAALLGDCVEKPQGKPTLVPITDKRPEFNQAADDFKDINL